MINASACDQCASADHTQAPFLYPPSLCTGHLTITWKPLYITLD